MLKIGSLRVILNLDQNYLFLTLFDLKWPSHISEVIFLPGISPGYHMSMHAKKWVPRPYHLPVIEKCNICDGQTDKQTDTQTENRHKLFLSLTFIDMTHINILILRHLVKIFHTDRQRKFIIWYMYICIYIYTYIYMFVLLKHYVFKHSCFTVLLNRTALQFVCYIYVYIYNIFVFCFFA